MWADSSQLQATAAWIRHRQGLTLKAMERFTALRGAITTMRRAYPQFLAAGGERLPPEVLRIIFPLDYWPLITKYLRGQWPGPVSDRRADGAGIHVHSGNQIRRECVRSAADYSANRSHAGAPTRNRAVHDVDAHSG